MPGGMTPAISAALASVRTIAEAWQISVEDAVRLMEPLHVQGDRDLRLRIETDE